MRSSLVRIILAAALMALTGGALHAQVFGIPLHNSGIPTGIGIAGEVGFPNAAYGKGTGFGATGQVGLGPIGFTATIASYKPSGLSSITGYGATANLKVFGGPLIPFSATLQGGLGYASKAGVKSTHFTGGLGLALNIPNPALAIKPWVAPRVDVQHVSGALGTNTETNFGFSAGIDFNLLGGLGFGAAYDWVKINGSKEAIFGLRASYVFKVPGL